MISNGVVNDIIFHGDDEAPLYLWVRQSATAVPVTIQVCVNKLLKWTHLLMYSTPGVNTGDRLMDFLGVTYLELIKDGPMCSDLPEHMGYSHMGTKWEEDDPEPLVGGGWVVVARKINHEDDVDINHRNK